MKKNKKGFSILELSAVLIIIGLLVAGISGSAKLVQYFKQEKEINDYLKN